MKRTQGQRLLGGGYAQALRVFADGDATYHAVLERCGVTRQTAQGICHAFHKHGLTHIAEWRRMVVNTRGYLTPVYRLGEGEDAPRPPYMRESKARTPVELLAFCHQIKALQDRTWHARGLAIHFGCSPRVMSNTIRKLRELRLVHIEEYKPRKGGGPGIALFGWGVDLRDNPRPKKSGATVYQQHNKVLYDRTQQIKLLHAMVRGVRVTGRRAANDQQEAA
jgi:hypothetical protein